MRLRTNISLVYGSDGELLTDQEGPISVFDRLLGGGLLIPDVVINSWINKPKKCAPYVLLISGPAGTGKTTLAMELVYRLSLLGITEPNRPEVVHTFPSIYISSESPGQLLVESKVREMGWERQRFSIAGSDGPQLIPSDRATVLVVGKDASPFDEMKNPAAFFKHLERYCAYDNLEEQLRCRPGVVVLDSLNILPPDVRGQHFLDLAYKLRGPFLMVIILDAAFEDAGDPFWTFVVDSVIRLSQSEREDPRVGKYLLGEFRIGKARWQKHAFGPHQIKIFGSIDPHSVHAPPGRKNYHDTGHLPPFRKDGGIQLYQSIHRHLSEGQQLVEGWETAPVAPADIKFDSSSLVTLDSEIGGGFPAGRCTAIIGDRGSFKSHLAYLWLLSAASRNEEPALLLSLRDDEAEALSRLNAIYDKEKNRVPLSPSTLIEKQLLRVVHFRPGYIAPDEFMFRLWFHVKDFKPQRLVIASLEQLDTLFPLCSVEPVFVPSILDLLATSKITSVAIGVSGGNQPPTQYGLLPQSSLILSFAIDHSAAPGRIRLTVSRLPTANPSGGGGWIYLDETTKQLQFASDDDTTNVP